MPWIVMCRVWGGVTGRREMPAKRNGEVLVFETEEEARAHQRACLAAVPRYGPAQFAYWVEPLAEPRVEFFCDPRDPAGRAKTGG